MIRVSELKLPPDGTTEQLKKKAARALGVLPKEITEMKIFRRSLDARKKDNIHYAYVVDVSLENEERILRRADGKKIAPAPDMAYRLPECGRTPEKRPVIIGFGPAGMFAALVLAEMGLRPIVLERGGDVESRGKAVERFWETGALDTENNVQFGEGGAGTFSDGKLTTRIKDPRCRKVLEEMAEAGAPEEILWDAKPHIGTDRLRGVVRNIRGKIITLGGTVRFHAKMTGFAWEDGKIRAVLLENGERLETDDIVLALGHSARDTFELLEREGFALEQKPFAVGVRIEHPQEMINKAQYGGAKNMPAADYRLTYTTKAGRGVYTFCMCPGGTVVAAASEEGRLAVNGMSLHARDGENANSALLVQVFPEDFGSGHPLAGMYFQRELEEKAFRAGGGGYAAPVQRVGAFLGTAGGGNGVRPTYRPDVKESCLDEILPAFLTEALREALPAMGRRLKGFDRPDAVLTAVESRSSSPVRILRGENGESLRFGGVYPAGEGAGYAGGIVSAAVDGIAAAEQIAAKYGWKKRREADAAEDGARRGKSAGRM